jgi:hypothetical protein
VEIYYYQQDVWSSVDPVYLNKLLYLSELWIACHDKGGAHTREKNHSKVFWAELNKLVGDAGKLESRLREYRL